jgi:hypothetical protein
MSEYRGNSDKSGSCYKTLSEYADSGCNKIIPPSPITFVPKVLQMFNPHPYSPPSGCSSSSCNSRSSSCNCSSSKSSCGCGGSSSNQGCSTWCNNPKNRCGSEKCECSQQNQGDVVENFGAFSISSAVRAPYNYGDQKITGVT